MGVGHAVAGRPGGRRFCYAMARTPDLLCAVLRCAGGPSKPFERPAQRPRPRQAQTRRNNSRRGRTHPDAGYHYGVEDCFRLSFCHPPEKLNSPPPSALKANHKRHSRPRAGRRQRPCKHSEESLPNKPGSCAFRCCNEPNNNC